MSTYFFDQTNGDDNTGDGSKGNPWQTIEKALATLTAGDIGIVRNNGGSETWGANKSPANHGRVTSPITLKADDGTEWPADLTNVTNTYAVTNGSKAIAASATENELSAGDQLKISGHDRWYTIASVSGTDVTLEMTYRGASGSGLSGTKLPAMPKIDCAASYQWGHARDCWQLERLHVHDAAPTGISITGKSVTIDGCRIMATSGSKALQISSNTHCLRSQMNGSYSGGTIYTHGATGSFLVDDCLVEGGLLGFHTTYLSGELRNIECTASTAVFANPLFRLTLASYNLKFTSAALIGAGYRGQPSRLRISVQDYDGTTRDNRIFTHLDPADNDAALRRNTSTIRTGGADSSIEVRPSTNVGTDADWRKLLVHEGYLYLPTSAKTVTVYFNLPAANFTTAPTATELWIELEYLADATNAGRRTVVSTGTITADGNWNSLSIGPITPAAAGEAFLRVWYCKTKEDGKSNYLYVDPELVIS